MGLSLSFIRSVTKGIEGAIQGPDNEWVILVQGSSSTDAGGNILESGTHGAGSALSADLEPGMYYIKEVFTNNEDPRLI